MPPKNKNKVKTNKFWKDLQKRYKRQGIVMNLMITVPMIDIFILIRRIKKINLF